MRKSNYVIKPVMKISDSDKNVYCGYEEIASAILRCNNKSKTIVTIECYPGVEQEEILKGLSNIGFTHVINSDAFAFEPEKMDEILEQDLTDDRVFGIMTTRCLRDFFYSDKILEVKNKLDNMQEGKVLIYGVGASLICDADVLIVADITRWEIQLRYRQGLNNWRTAKNNQSKSAKYKRGFFAEWRWADKEKKHLINKMDFYLDMTAKGKPVMTTGDEYRYALEVLSRRPFRMVPYFDPGVWGGDWMKNYFGLPENGSNYAWSFDGVPEENSILLGFGDKTIEIPAINLVHAQPQKLLGERVHARFGTEFPIRFDLLDTIHGQNLSLQVHPITEYIQEHFNMHYTQDESYYILDTEGNDTNVWLGLRENIDKKEMTDDLYRAQNSDENFSAEKYVNKIPVKKHDHVLIPAGTVHCSGANTMVLEISATPYIFTFKMWDWARNDLDGKPRPIHLEHALKNIQWDRDTKWITQNLIKQEKVVHSSEEYVIERTGLHQREFIDTYRVTTKSEAPIKRNGSVHVLNLVEGECAAIISEGNEFEPFEVHYAETFIVPEGAGAYSIKAQNNESIKMIIACVRE